MRKTKCRKSRREKVCRWLSLILTVAMLAGSLSGMSFQAQAAAGDVKAGEQQGRVFQHSGLLHTEAGFEKIKENIKNNVEPNLTTWNQLKGDGFSSASWNPRPVETVVRGGNGANVAQFYIDIRRAYQNALIWRIDGSEEHGKAACRILNAWSSNLKKVTGTSDQFLASGIYGYTLANAAELMREHPDFNLEAMQTLLVNVFYPMNDNFLKMHNGAHIGNYWANWDLANIAAMISIGVFCDREDIYQQAVDYYKTGLGNGSIYNTMPYVYKEGVAQWQEAGRDQGHNTLGLGLCQAICETAWNQGDDLYGLSDNRLLKATEYTVRYNYMNEDMPYSPYEWLKGQTGQSNWQTVLSNAGRGINRPIYSMLYNHYVNRKGLQSEALEKKLYPEDGPYIEGAQANGDELGWQTLTFANLSERVEDQPIEGDFADGVYRIRSVQTGKSLVDENGSLKTAEKGSSEAEWWSLKNKGDGEYVVTNTVTGNVMQVNSDDNEESDSEYYSYETVIGTGKADQSLSQNFAFVKNDSGDYRIIPTINYFVLSLQDASKADTSIVQRRNSSASGQKWIVEKMSETQMEYTFDDEASGFISDYTKVTNNGCTMEAHGSGKALSLNGTDNFLTLETKKGENPLAGAKEFTLSLEVKPDSSADGNWIFYAGAETGNAYIGLKEENGKITYYNGQTAVLSAQTETGADGWYHLTLVYTGKEVILYLNGEEKARKEVGESVFELLGQSSVLQIGKGSSEEYYKGQIDSLKITGKTLTKGEIIAQAGDYANITVPEVLVDFDFDDEETGLTGGEAVATGSHSLKEHGEGKALYLNGFYTNYLKVTGKDGTSLLPGGQVKELTISVQAKREGGSGWVFYAAPNDYTQNLNKERYIGVADQGNKILAERYANQGTRSPSASGNIQAGRWHYITVVLTETEIIVYDNGEEKARKTNNTPLAEILGGDSIWYIGKANWGKGEFFQGLIDNYKVISRAWTPAQVKEEALKYVDKEELQSAIDHAQSREESQYTKERWENYTKALADANTVLADREALQSAVDSAANALNLVSSWMRLDEALNDSIAESEETKYTSTSWEPYVKALQAAKEMQEKGNAEHSKIDEATKALTEAQKALINKDGQIEEVISKINEIGEVKQTPECSRRIIQARQACNLLTETELSQVTNLSVLQAAEQGMAGYLAEFTFDDEKTGLIGGQAAAEGEYTIQDGALYLDGSAEQWLNVTKFDGTPLLTGVEELTISVTVKPESGRGNWIYYAAPNKNVQAVNQETYLGLLERDGNYTAERYKNSGSRPQSASAKADNSQWHYITLVYSPEETIFYVDGAEASREASSIALPDIFGENGILQIGKANWGSGEYYRGLIDNFKILGTAMPAEEIKDEASAYLDQIVDPDRVADVIAKINAIGEIEVTAESRGKIEQAREAYEKLTSAEKALVTNIDSLTSAEEVYKEMAEETEAILAQFTFDDEENGLKSSGAVAAANNTPVFVEDSDRGKVLSLDGTGSVWLNVTKEDGTPLLTGVEELTVSYYSKAQRTDTNWVFYAAPNGNAQGSGKECYLGIRENGGSVIAERFLNGRQDSANGAYESGWNHITVVYGANNTKIYVNGILASTANNNGSLKQILGENSILQIGKANWGKGEYYQGLLDDFVIYNYALSEREIQVQDGIIADPKNLKAKIREAKAIQKGNYTDESYQALQAAIAVAKAAYETVTTEEEVTAAVVALQTAMDNLEEKKLEEPDKVDLTPLTAKIQEAKAIKQGNYTDESYQALQTAILAAEEALKTVATQEEVTEAVNDLQTAIDNLKEKKPEGPDPDKIDLTPLTAKINTAKAIEQGNYTDESYQALQTAIAAAEEALKTVTTQEQVTEAVNALQTAIDHLEEKGSEEPVKPGTIDLTPLTAKINTAKAIEQGNYTDESYQALQTAIAAAEEAVKTVATQEEVTEAVNALQTAIDHLEETGGSGRPGKVPVKQIEIVPKKKTLKIGQKFTIKVTINPSNASNQAVKITSSNSKIAKVSENEITAKSPGKATIKVTAKDGSGVKASMTIYVRQKTVAKVKATQQSTSRYVKVTFGKVKGASGYYIYRSTKAKKGYKKIGSTKKTSFIDKKAKASKTYYYKVVTKSKVSGCNSVLSTKYAKVKVLARPVLKVKAQKGRKIIASWKKVKGCKGYVVYTSTKKIKGFKTAKVLKTAKTVKTKIKAKKSVKKLYVKVRPYYTEKGKKRYGAYSKTVYIKIKK